MKTFIYALSLTALALLICMPVYSQFELNQTPAQKEQFSHQLPNGHPGPLASDAEIRAWKAQQPLPTWEPPRGFDQASRVAPANDNCANAIPISCGQTIAGTTIGATADPGASCSNAPGVWYKFTGNGSNVQLSTCNMADYDTRISVYTDGCGTLTCVGENDDNPGCGLTSSINIKTQAGREYLVHVNGFCCGQTGNFSLTLTCNAFCDITDFSAYPYCDGSDKFDMDVFIYGHDLPVNGNQKFVLDGQVLTPDFVFVSSDFMYVFFDDLTVFGSNMDMFVQADWGCTWTKWGHVTVPAGCGPNPPCDVTDLTLRTANPTPCNGDGTHDLKIKVHGESLPATDADAKVVIDGREYPIASYVKRPNGTVNIRINNVDPSGNFPNVFVQVEDGCTRYEQDMYQAPNCGNARLAGPAGNSLIYPNPTTGSFTISGAGISRATFRVVNPLGQVIRVGTIENFQDTEVDLSGYENGLYIVTIAQGDEVITRRMIKQ